MLKQYFFGLIIVIGLFHFGQTSQSNSSAEIQGSLSKLTRAQQVRAQLEQNFVIDFHRTERDWHRMVQQVIFHANPKLDGLSRETSTGLTREVVRVSQCYGIDPGIFSALIWRESNFRPKSTSETGAVGLTQMTQSGVHEVLERLAATSSRRLKHLRALVQKCNPKIYERLPGAVSADTVAAWKNAVLTSKTQSLVMGALLLKINLAHAKGATMSELYRHALERYNGDPKVKVQFATDVLRMERQLMSPTQFAVSDSKFLKSLGQF